MYKKMKMLCLRRGWTMKDVAEKLNISESYLYKLISGDRCSRKRLKEITDLLYEDYKPIPIFKNYVKTKCREKDIRLKELAKSLGISLSYLYDILNGRRENKRIKKKLDYFVKNGVILE